MAALSALGAGATILRPDDWRKQAIDLVDTFQWEPWVGAVALIALVPAAVAAIHKFLNNSMQAEKHIVSSAGYRRLKERS